MRRRGFLLAVTVVLGLAACREDAKEITVTQDISAWPEYCLGYHTFRAPPDLQPGRASAVIDDHAISVQHDIPGRPLGEVLGAQPDVGQVLYRTSINGWDIQVTTRDNGLVESSTRLNLLAAQRASGRIVMTSRVFPRSLWDGTGPADLWAWHAATRPLAEAGAGSFCVEDVAFVATTPPKRTRFSRAFGIAADGSTADAPLMRSDVSLSLLALHYPEDMPEDDRPLAPAQDLSEMPGVSVTSEKLSVNNRDTGFATTEIVTDGKTRLVFDALIFGEGETPNDPRSISLGFTDARLAPDQARQTALAILSSLRARE